MSVAWVFLAISVLAVLSYQGTDGQRVGGLVAFTMVYVVSKLGLIIAATVLMYKPGVRDYFH